jgi:hypothetical protein
MRTTDSSRGLDGSASCLDPSCASSRRQQPVYSADLPRRSRWSVCLPACLGRLARREHYGGNINTKENTVMIKEVEGDIPPQGDRPPQLRQCRPTPPRDGRRRARLGGRPPAHSRAPDRKGPRCFCLLDLLCRRRRPRAPEVPVGLTLEHRGGAAVHNGGSYEDHRRDRL